MRTPLTPGALTGVVPEVPEPPDPVVAGGDCVVVVGGDCVVVVGGF